MVDPHSRNTYLVRGDPCPPPTTPSDESATLDARPLRPPLRRRRLVTPQVRFHTPGYSMGVRQAIFRRYNATDRFFLRDLRGDSVKGVHKALDPRQYLQVLRQSKFCLAPSGMGFSTRTYESVAQGCVPLIIQVRPGGVAWRGWGARGGGRGVGGGVGPTEEAQHVPDCQ